MNLSAYLDGAPSSDEEDGECEIVAAEKEENFETTAEEVLEFVFPKSLKHPRSAGRLFAFALCGPLRNGQLRCGKFGSQAMTRRELDAMCRQFEREDALRVYVDRIGLLTIEEQERVISEVPHFPRVEREDVVALLSGKNGFHEIQAAILNLREERIKNLKLMYPAVPQVARNDRGATTTTTTTENKAKRRGRSRLECGRRQQLSPEVAPPEMFSKNKGLTPNGIASHTNKLLSVHASHLCHMEDGNSTDLTANVRLIRHDQPNKHLSTDRFTCASPPILDVVPFRKLMTEMRHSSR